MTTTAQFILFCVCSMLCKQKKNSIANRTTYIDFCVTEVYLTRIHTTPILIHLEKKMSVKSSLGTREEPGYNKRMICNKFDKGTG